MMSTKPGEGTRYWKQQVTITRDTSSLKPTVVSGRTLRNGKCSSVNVQMTVQFLKLYTVCVQNAVQTVWTTLSVSETNCGEQDLLQHVSVVIGRKRSTKLEQVNRTYLLTPRCRVLLEKLTGLQLVKKSSPFHGTRNFITALTSVRHLSLSWANPIQSTYPLPTSWRSILILSTILRLGLPSGLFPSGLPTKTLYAPLSSPMRATCPAHLILLDFITRTILGEEYRTLSSSLCILLHSPVSDQASHPYKTTGKIIIVPYIS